MSRASPVSPTRSGHHRPRSRSAMIRVTPSISLAEHELEEQFIRAPGPGDKNANSVETPVGWRCAVAPAPSLPEDGGARLNPLAGSRLPPDGGLVTDPPRHRTQARNRQDARARLIELIRRAA